MHMYKNGHIYKPLKKEVTQSISLRLKFRLIDRVFIVINVIK